LAGACGRSGGSTPGAGPTPLPTSFPSAATSATLVGAGDIAVCGSPGAADTARLLDGIPGTIFTAGDNASPNGRIEDFRDCYGPSWGRHKDRTRPSPGNHDYESPGAAPYFQYFGLNAGPAGRGYYSYGIGAWTAYSLNSNVSMATASGQVSWLRGELTETVSECSVAYWHHPLFSSGHNGNNPQARGGEDPPGQGARFADAWNRAMQRHPGGLEHVLGVGAIEPHLERDGQDHLAELVEHALPRAGSAGADVGKQPAAGLGQARRGVGSRGSGRGRSVGGGIAGHRGAQYRAESGERGGSRPFESVPIRLYQGGGRPLLCGGSLSGETRMSRSPIPLAVAAALASCLFAVTSSAQQPTQLTIPQVTQAGAPFEICLDAPGNSLLFLLVSDSLGATPTKYGNLCLGFPFLAIILFPMPATNNLCFPCDLPCMPGLYGLTVHMQAVSLGPAEGQLAMSPCSSMTILQGSACGGGSGTEPGDFATWTMGGWGANCAGNNIACTLAAHFDEVYAPPGLILGDQDGVDGDEHTAIVLTSAAALANFLPEGQTPGTIASDMVDPKNCTSGVISGQLAAAKLNVAFDDAGILDGFKNNLAVHLGDLVFVANVHRALHGMTVREVIGFADLAISGEVPVPVDVDGDTVGDVSLSDLSTALDAVNNNFHEGNVDNGSLALP
jgi:hypothetical protein